MAQDYCQEDVDRLQCPFTWDLSQFDVDKITWNSDDTVKFTPEPIIFIPESQFTKFLALAYARIVKIKYAEAEEKLEEAKDIIKEIKSKIKKDVAEHILEATKIHFLIKKENLEEIDELLKAVKSIDDKMYVSPLNEFLASFWTYMNYCTETTKIAIKFAKIAIKHDSKAATSHYLLARNLRTIRRTISNHKLPTEDELKHFKKAYEMEKNPKFALFYAMGLKENKKFTEAMEIFNEIHNMNLQCVSIQLRLALAFTHNGDFDKAKKCLDYVESERPDKSMFLHYKGIYLLKKNQYKEASEYLLKATAVDLSYPAEMSYIDCMKLLNEPVDFTSHLLKVQEKFSQCENARKKTIMLNIAFSYFYNDENFEESMKYFSEALEMKEEELSIKEFSYKFGKGPVNVYHFVINKLLPKIQDDPEKEKRLSTEAIEMKKKLTKICKPHLPYRPPSKR